MAEFCKQCSEDLFGEDFKEFAGLTTPEDDAAGLACVVLCEGCGPIQVDPDGVCISKDCAENGHKEMHLQEPVCGRCKKGTLEGDSVYRRCRHCGADGGG